MNALFLRIAIFTGCLASVGFIFWLDTVTTVWLSLSIFLLVPIWIAAWYVGEYSGYVIGGLASFAAFAVESNIYPADIPTWVLAWNASSKTAFFMLFAMMAARMRRSLDHEREVSRSDALTGTATRRVLCECLEREIAAARRNRRNFALAYIDLDNFKAVNDQHGHAVGDEALILVASTIRAHIRGAEVLARLGGDEFAVLLRDTDATGAQKAVMRLRDALLAAMRSREWPITFSIGVTVYDGVLEATPEQLISATDAVMYEVKRDSKDAMLLRAVGAERREAA
jgi:diguanylate cyclase (GGDEF)-like protein